jgi:hypothetical protein
MLSTSMVPVVLGMFLIYIQRDVIDNTVAFTWLSLIAIIVLSRIALMVACQRSLLGNSASAHI